MQIKAGIMANTPEKENRAVKIPQIKLIETANTARILETIAIVDT